MTDPRSIVEVELQLGGMGGYDACRVLIIDEKAIFSMGILDCGDPECPIGEKGNIAAICQALGELHFEYWLSDCPQEGELRIRDGRQWNRPLRISAATAHNRMSAAIMLISKKGMPIDFFGIDFDESETDEECATPLTTLSPSIPISRS
jgi:hypothetical protein